MNSIQKTLAKMGEDGYHKMLLAILVFVAIVVVLINIAARVFISILPTLPSAGAEDFSVTNGMFVTLFVISVALNIFVQKSNWVNSRMSRDSKRDLSIFLIGTVTLHWFLWSVLREKWLLWLDSPSFWIANISAFVFMWFISKNEVGWAKRGLGVIFLYFLVWWGYDSVETEMVPVTSSRTASTISSVMPEKLADRPYVVFDGPMLEEVRTAFPTDTVMWDIAACESNLRQFGSDGAVLTNTNTNNTTDSGIFQINSVHKSLADSLGYDYMTVEGNINMASALVQNKIREGGDPYQDWNASRYCWQDHFASRPTSTSLLALDLVEFQDSIVIAPAEGRSQWIQIPKGFDVRFTAHSECRPYKVVYDKGNDDIVPCDRNLPVVKTTALAFESIDSEPFVVRVSRFRTR